MSYQVLWDPDVVSALQKIHDESLDPESIRHTVERIGAELSHVP